MHKRRRGYFTTQDGAGCVQERATNVRAVILQHKNGYEAGSSSTELTDRCSAISDDGNSLPQLGFANADKKR